MSELQLQAIKVQIDALVESWQREWHERKEDIEDSDSKYQQGYNDALDRCTQALRILL